MRIFLSGKRAWNWPSECISLPLARPSAGIAAQIERAAVSVSNNIAEGFERGTTQELLTFLYIARGSAGEVRSMLCLLVTLDDFAHLKSEISNLKSMAEGVSRQLRAWADSLQNSPITGQRYLTEKSRRASKTRTECDEFLRKLQNIREGKEPGGNLPNTKRQGDT